MRTRRVWGPLPILFAVLLVAALAAVAGSAVAQGGEGTASPIYGKTIYRVYCASCHGAEAAGDGKLAEYLTVKPSDLTALAVKNGGEFPAERLIGVIDGREAVRGHAGEMPVWGDAFQKADALENEPPEVREREVQRKIEALVAYLRSIQVQEE
jgi:mono/diheme cytochrome c family protein